MFKKDRILSLFKVLNICNLHKNLNLLKCKLLIINNYNKWGVCCA